MDPAAVSARRGGAWAALLVALVACRKAPPPPREEPSPPPIATVPPVALTGEPVSAFADASAEGDRPPYEQARAYEAGGQHWLARLVLEGKALGPEGTKPEVELLASVCQAQGDQRCLDECGKRLGKKLELASGASSAPALPAEHKEPDSDAARARDHLLKGELSEARAILEPKIVDGKASKEEIRLLRSACKDQGDRMCVALCDAKLR